MKLLRLAALMALACVVLPIAGCTTLIHNPVNQTQVYQLENAYGLAQSAAVAYSALPRCKAGTSATVTNVCATHAIVAALATDDAKARTALTALESFSRNPANYPGLTFSGLLSAAQLAVTTLTTIEAQNGIGS